MKNKVKSIAEDRAGQKTEKRVKIITLFLLGAECALV